MKSMLVNLVTKLTACNESDKKNYESVLACFGFNLPLRHKGTKFHEDVLRAPFCLCAFVAKLVTAKSNALLNEEHRYIIKRLYAKEMLHIPVTFS